MCIYYIIGCYITDNKTCSARNRIIWQWLNLLLRNWFKTKSTKNGSYNIWSIWRNSFFNLIRYYNKRLRAVILANWGSKEDSKKGGGSNCGQCLFEKNIFIVWFPHPHFQILFINETLDFLDLFKLKPKRINIVD